MAGRAEVDQALAVLDTYHRQIEVLTRQLNFLQAVLNEAARARESLEGLETETNKELLVPLGSNTFLYATLANRERVLSGIGAGITLEKTWEEAKAGLAKREDEVQQEMQRLSESTVRLQQEAAKLQEDVQTSLNEIEGAPEA